MNFTTKMFSVSSMLVISIGAGSIYADTLLTEIAPSWTRPTSIAEAAATLTTYAQWNGFAVPTATNDPTGDSYFGAGLAVPTAGDSSYSAGDGAFIISDGTANNAYYSDAATGDIYSFSGVITPQINEPGYDVAGNQLNVLVQVQMYGQDIDTSQLTANGVEVSTLANYSLTETYAGPGSDFGGFGTAYTNDYAWAFTLPADTDSLQLNFGWGVTSSAVQAVAIDTQSVPSSVPAPTSLALLSVGVVGLVLLKRRHSV